MPQTNPNRTKNQTVHNQNRKTQSGDQHLLPEDEPLQDPHRPHRISREDMQKLHPADPDRTIQPRLDCCTSRRNKTARKRGL